MDPKRTLVVLTTYNRPTLVRDAIASVLDGEDKNTRLLIMDDGCSAESRTAIEVAIGPRYWSALSLVSDAQVATSSDGRVTWWKGPQRTMPERKASIPYSRTINIALNHLIRGERYVCYLCDDDALYPESIRLRADYLDAHPEVHVVYGRLRAVQYAKGGYNTWNSADRPLAGMHFPRPIGPRVQVGEGGKRCYFLGADGGVQQIDPQTGLPYIEEGYWEPGPLRYGSRGAPDHNQVMHRIDCLSRCRPWPRRDTYVEYWGEDVKHGVGDAAFFRLLGEAHPFEGVDVWTVTKKYHSKSMGCGLDSTRE